MPVAVDTSTLGWGVVQDAQGNVASGTAYTLTNVATGQVISGSTGTKGEIAQTLDEGSIWTLVVGGVTKTVQVPDTGRSTRQSVNLRDYGAQGTGDNIDAALTAAKTALGANGGVIFIPAGDYVSTSFPSFDDTRNITLKGNGGMSAGAQTSSRITFTGTGNGTWLSAKSSFGFALEDLQLLYNSAAFTGTLINFDAKAASPDTHYARIDRCYIGGSGVRSAFVLLSLDKAIAARVSQSVFAGSQQAVYGPQAGGSYSVQNSFYGCTFLGQTSMNVRNPERAWLFSGCVFENLVTAGGAVAGAGAIFSAFSVQGLTINSCWCGDANTTGEWFTLDGSAIVMTGNLIGAGNTGVRFVANNTTGILVAGNSFDSQNTNGIVINAITGAKDWVVAANQFKNIGGLAIAAAVIPTASVIQDPAGGRLIPYGLTPVIASTVVADGNFPATPPDGTTGYASTTQKHAVRVGGVWKHSAAYT